MERYSLEKLHSSLSRLLVGPLFLCCLLYTGQGNVQAQSAPEELKTSPGEGNADSLRVVTAIATSRDIHRKNHEETLEYQHAEKAVALALNMKDTLLYA